MTLTRELVHKTVTLQGHHVLRHNAERAGVPARVFVPYTKIHPAVEAALDAPEWVNGLAAGWVRVKMTEPSSYPDFLAARWKEGLGWILNEHDVLPWPGALAELWKCSEEWCTYAYGYNEKFGNGSYLGCVKFSSSFIEKTKGLWDAPAWEQTERHPDAPFWAWGGDGQRLPRDWQHCDGHLVNYAKEHDLTFHQHFPSVTHLH